MSALPKIPAAEFAARRAAARNLCKAAGLDALLVCARGGGTVDRYADVMYLANYYTSFPYTPDHPGEWSGRAHTFIVLPVEGRPRLIIDLPDDGSAQFDDGEVIYTDFVIEAVIQALKDSGLENARIGLCGEDVLPVRYWRQITGAMPAMTCEPADHILTGLRSVKSPAEVDMLRHASKIGSRMLDAMLVAAVPGATHGEILSAGMQLLLPERGILYNSFMASGRGGDEPTNSRSNFPTWASPEPLREGDWFRAGISGMLGGYVFDLSRSCPVGAPTNRQIDMFEAAISCVEAAVEATRPGALAGDLADAGLGKQRALGFGLDSVFSGMGHGIGLGWDAPWLTPGEPTELVPGMVLCLERTVSQDGYLGDFEETVLVTPDGFERLTDARTRYW
ncbi:M24 family metallopeptidase [Pseudogemmobacter humi]|uniref:Creatinase n=1 Tax=Pseudogemmobacter humi TaxID=2483812 RepID=A0A3P5XPG8_9RHOB|nr:M24 family metallopeptidase [Pseudogemmobacter humi]VDC33596.1 Creatinase [Pseudogemmobacter humi]